MPSIGSGTESSGKNRKQKQRSKGYQMRLQPTIAFAAHRGAGGGQVSAGRFAELDVRLQVHAQLHVEPREPLVAALCSILSVMEKRIVVERAETGNRG